MIRIVLIWVCLALPALQALPALAVQPDEILADPQLEARARALSRELRCVQCQSENIDDSNAAIARDLRLLVRERLLAGDSDAAVKDYLVARYGDFVLLNPPARGANWLLWLAGPAMLLAGAAIAVAATRRRSEDSALTAEEQARLRDLTGD
ncbi:MAG: cytochrome c-type biogenesis protein CcmH [Rhodobacteraceae bacterium]|nr:cytochrome c-type biogenesis protein CcmH [Paracoccaceae bacterium]